MTDGTSQSLPLLLGKGEMNKRIREYEWHKTPLGSIETWPHTLRTAVDLMLGSPQPVYIAWGSELISLYNDGYIPIAGSKHPRSLGEPYRVMWAEIWDNIRPIIEGTAIRGESHIFYDLPLPVAGRPQRPMGWFTTTATPIRDEFGQPAGLYTVALETTERVLAEAEMKQSFEALFNSIDEGLAIVEMIYDDDGKIVDMIFRQVNAAYERQGGIRNVVGRSVTEMLPGVEDVWLERYREVATTGVPLRVEDYQRDVDRWFDVYFSRVDKEGRFVAIVFNDISERKRDEVALRESEERFRQFADASAAGLWIRAADSLTMEFVSPAAGEIYGVEPDALLGDVKGWAAIIVPEDRDEALAHLERARAGATVTHEFRILRPSDGAFRWIRTTDFPLRGERGSVRRIGGIAEDVTESKQAAEHQGVLLHELQHRVRNILAMIRSVADQTGDTAGDVEDYRDLLDGRLRALARVQVMLTQAANAGVDLATLIRAEVDAQAAHDGQCSLRGPDLVLSPKAAEVLTLAIHELATNALKYGAFSHAAGRLAIDWRVFYPAEEPWLELDWVETGASTPLAPPQRGGFGTLLIEQRIPYELRGRGQVTVAPEGARCRLEFPLRRGDSILETDGVTLSMSIAGGSLDMAGEADLNGCRVLVIEDDYFLARDTGRAVRKAGGHVLGPVGQEDQALALIAAEAPTCALVDINLGEGAQFRVAGALQDRGVPFVFVTGYDDVMIPARFDGVERIRKPTDFRQVVRAAARLCTIA